MKNGTNISWTTRGMTDSEIKIIHSKKLSDIVEKTSVIPGTSVTNICKARPRKKLI